MEDKTDSTPSQTPSEAVKDSSVGETTSEKRNKQTKAVLIVIALIVISIFVVPLIIKQSNNFKYAGIGFEKIKYGEMTLFYSRIPITSITGQVVANYNLYLRNDPRKLEDIPIKGDIKLMKNVIMAADDNMVCPNEIVAGASLSGFLQSAGMTLSTGTTNKTEADLKNITYADCNSFNSTVIAFELSNQTEIIRENVNCYKIKISDCQVVEAAERFMVGVIAHSNGLNTDERF